MAAQPDWTDLPVRSHPGPLHSALEQCYHWGGRLLSGETESCCCGGKIAIAPLPALWKEVFQGPAFRAHSRQYNNLFTFTTVMGVSGHTAGDTAPHSHPVRSTSLVCVNSLRSNLKHTFFQKRTSKRSWHPTGASFLMHPFYPRCTFWRSTPYHGSGNGGQHPE